MGDIFSQFHDSVSVESMTPLCALLSSYLFSHRVRVRDSLFQRIGEDAESRSLRNRVSRTGPTIPSYSVLAAPVQTSGDLLLA